MGLKELEILARKMGGREARLISPADVFTPGWVRLKCQYGCDVYGRCLTCPPFSPKPEETRKILDGYKKVLLVHFRPDAEVKKIMVKLEREVFLQGFYRAFALGAGPCYLCKTCNLKQCRYPDKARPSMESAGIDVFATARKAGFPIEVLDSYDCRPNYYGLLLVE